MKKILTVLLMLNLLVLLLSACADEKMEINPQMIEVFEELVQEEEPEHIVEIETVPTHDPLTESVQVVEVAEIQETTDNPQDTIISTPTEALTLAPKPTQSNESTQAANQTSVTTQQSTPEPVQSSTPTLQATPEPVPEPIPEPIPQPTPLTAPSLPTVTEPPSARTICNTCGADITDNLVEHGTAHLINDENFSYRNE